MFTTVHNTAYDIRNWSCMCGYYEFHPIIKLLTLPDHEIPQNRHATVVRQQKKPKIELAFTDRRSIIRIYLCGVGCAILKRPQLRHKYPHGFLIIPIVYFKYQLHRKLDTFWFLLFSFPYLYTSLTVEYTVYSDWECTCTQSIINWTENGKSIG